ncbi:hypothetical protein FF098_009570 [Parvularcula flava]|uniref:Uncharacterized protein n=1 Tax=Aquisalinus luteolus TaxID=1566827 RepID=A0A8J3A8A6_9PROT|nr:hypothetical protein [Aquisalinus luteolus]NHK28150.1 hypothetical protein [Aquisalinus luteolus]GGH97613.1 hypothetical protein GCM10011355_19260 [Aquisalinus luteolus]
MKSSLSICVVALVAAAGFTMPAQAQSSGWQEYDFSISADGAWLDSDDPDGKYAVNGVYAAAAEGGSAMFYCVDEELAVFVSTEPFDFVNDMRQSNRKVTITVRLSADEEEVNRSDWRYFPSVKLAQPAKYTTIAKLYNAVVKQEAMSMSSSRFSDVSITLPPVDSTFAAFSRDCGM